MIELSLSKCLCSYVQIVMYSKVTVRLKGQAIYKCQPLKSKSRFFDRRWISIQQNSIPQSRSAQVTHLNRCIVWTSLRRLIKPFSTSRTYIYLSFSEVAGNEHTRRYYLVNPSALDSAPGRLRICLLLMTNHAEMICLELSTWTLPITHQDLNRSNGFNNSN